jgi:hypothetical protein
MIDRAGSALPISANRYFSSYSGPILPYSDGSERPKTVHKSLNHAILGHYETEGRQFESGPAFPRDYLIAAGHGRVRGAAQRPESRKGRRDLDQGGLGGGLLGVADAGRFQGLRSRRRSGDASESCFR